MSRRRKWLVGLAVIVILLVAIRIALPPLLTWRFNEALADLPNHTGRLEDVDLYLWRGAYALDGLVIEQRDSELDTPFLELDRLDVTVHWKALTKGEVVGELDVHGLEIAFVQGESDTETQVGQGLDWRAQLERLYPFRFNRIDAHDAAISFRAPGIETEQRILVTGLDVHVRDLTNISEEAREAFATFDAKGQVMGSGRLELGGRFDPNAETPTFDVNFGLSGVPLTELNAWLEQYANVDAEAGLFGLYAEVATKDKAFDGYVKPVIEDLEILDLQEDADNPFQVVWESAVAAVAAVLKNPETDQLATRIPLQGELEDPEADVFTAMFGVLRNAFVTAFSAAIDHSISMADVLPGGEEGENDGEEPEAE